MHNKELLASRAISCFHITKTILIGQLQLLQKSQNYHHRVSYSVFATPGPCLILRRATCFQRRLKVDADYKKRRAQNYKYALNLILYNTNCIVTLMIHSHWTVIQDFERGSIAQAAAEKSTQNGLERTPTKGLILLRQENAPALQWMLTGVDYGFDLVTLFLFN